MPDRDELARPDLSTEKIARRALALAGQAGDQEAEERWQLVVALHRRPEESVFEMASAWCRSSDPRERELGADVLAQLGHTGSGSPFGERSRPILLGLLGDPEPRVLQSAITGLGHLATEEIVWDPAVLGSQARHPDASVRHAVAFALGGTQCDASPAAVALILELMTDADLDVRNWATFGLAISDADSDCIRAALLERVDDEDREVRGEALLGLARRGEERVLPILVGELSRPEVSTLAIVAAGELARPELLVHLEELLEANPGDGDIAEAIRSCRGSKD